MQESSKSTPMRLPEISEDPRLLREYIKVLEERVGALEKLIAQVPDAMAQQKIMYRRPGKTKHETIAHYLDDVESRLLAMELKQELGF